MDLCEKTILTPIASYLVYFEKAEKVPFCFSMDWYGGFPTPFRFSYNNKIKFST
jgi:hypothetical protein